MSASGEPSVWVRRGLEIGAFVGICAIFAVIGAARDTEGDPGIAASRMARIVGAPLALLTIGAVELILWLVKSQNAKQDQSSPRPTDRR